MDDELIQVQGDTHIYLCPSKVWKHVTIFIHQSLTCHNITKPPLGLACTLGVEILYTGRIDVIKGVFIIRNLYANPLP